MERTVIKKRFWSRQAANTLLESALVTFGVLFGFAIREWRDNQIREEQRINAIAKLEMEIQNNRSIVNEWLEGHRALYTRLEAEMTRPQGGVPLGVLYRDMEPSKYLLQETAWQTASNTNLLMLFEYKTTFALTNTYKIQNEGVMLTLKEVADFQYQRENYREQDKREILFILLRLHKKLIDQEEYLVKNYKKTLDELKREVPEPGS